MISEPFPKYQSGAKLTCLIIGVRQLQAVMASSIASLLFRRRCSVILFRGLQRLTFTNQSIYMSAPTRDYYSVMICSMRKIHRSRKQLHCAIHGFLRKVHGTIDCAARSMDRADPQIAPNTNPTQSQTLIVTLTPNLP